MAFNIEYVIGSAVGSYGGVRYTDDRKPDLRQCPQYHAYYSTNVKDTPKGSKVLISLISSYPIENIDYDVPDFVKDIRLVSSVLDGVNPGGYIYTYYTIDDYEYSTQSVDEETGTTAHLFSFEVPEDLHHDNSLLLIMVMDEYYSAGNTINYATGEKEDFGLDDYKQFNVVVYKEA